MSNDTTTIDRQGAQIRMNLADRLRDIGAANYGLPVCDKAADELDRQATQIAMLADVLNKVRECAPSGHVFEIINAALNATQADVEAWQAAHTTPPASPTPLKQHSRFTCPKCGSHKFGTSIHGDNPKDWVGHCDFRVDDDIGCQFSWPRTDDHLYFTAP